MSKEYVSPYPEGSLLKTEQRKALYQELMENDDCFGEKGKNFVRALKALVFEGKLESYAQSIKDEKAFCGSRGNDLGYMLPAYICLASPLVTVEFFVSVLSRYSRDICISITGDIETALDGRPSLSDEMFVRVRCLLDALDQMEGVDFPLLGIGGDSLARVFNRFLSMVCYRGNSKNCLFPSFFERFDTRFQVVSVRAEERIKDVVELLEMLFGSCPITVSAYTDAAFIAFCHAYFSRALGPDLLTYLDDVYQSIPEHRRIHLDGDKIIYFTEPT